MKNEDINFYGIYKCINILFTNSEEEMKEKFSDEREFIFFIKGVYDTFNSFFQVFYINDYILVKLMNVFRYKRDNNEINDLSKLYINTIAELTEVIIDVSEDERKSNYEDLVLHNIECRGVSIYTPFQLSMYMAYDYEVINKLENDDVDVDIDLFIASSFHMLEISPNIYNDKMVKNSLLILDNYINSNQFRGDEFNTKVKSLKEVFNSFEVNSSIGEVVVFNKVKNME